jgi:hypothetical protein
MNNITNRVLYRPVWTDRRYRGISRATIGTIPIMSNANIIFFRCGILNRASAYPACEANAVEASTVNDVMKILLKRYTLKFDLKSTLI